MELMDVQCQPHAPSEALMDAVRNILIDAVLAFYRNRTSVAQKRSRLEMLVTKIRSVVEVYEKTEIQSEGLRIMQQDFQAAVTQGDEVLRKLQDKVNSSSSSSSLSGICISSIKRLFSGTEDEKNLNSTIELLEKRSAEVKDFLRMLKIQLEVAKQKRKLGLERAPEALQQKIEINKVGRDHEACLGNRSPPRPVLVKFTDHAKPKMLESEEDPKLHESTGQAPELHETAKRSKRKRRKPAKLLEQEGEMKRAKPTKREKLAKPAKLLEQETLWTKQAKRESLDAVQFHSGNTLQSWRSKLDIMMSSAVHAAVQDVKFGQFFPMPADIPNSAGLKAEIPWENLISGSKDPKFLDIFGGGEEIIGPLVEEKLVTPNLPHSLSSRTIEDLAAVEDLVAKIQSALDVAMKHGAVEDGWFGQLIAKLREAMKEGNSVASAIKSNNYCVHDQISDEVGEIVKAVRLRLESVHDDLEDFTNLAEVEELVRELTPAGPSIAHT